MGLEDMLGNTEIQILDLTNRNRRYDPNLTLKENRRRDFQWHYDVQLGLNQKIVDGDSERSTAMLVKHDHVWTVGAAGVNPDGSIMDGLLKKDHPPDVPVIKVDRGGKITYHGPGQLVVYHINRIQQDQLLAHKIAIENFYLDILRHPDFGIDSYSRKYQDASYGRGGWLVHNGKPRKVVSQGTGYINAGRDKQTGKMSYATLHGFAMNVDVDMDYFRGIHPCGFDSELMISMSEILGREVKLDEVKKHVVQKIRELE